MPGLALLAARLGRLVVIAGLLLIVQVILGVLAEHVFFEYAALATILKHSVIATAVMIAICLALAVPIVFVVRCPRCRRRWGSWIHSKGPLEFERAHGQTLWSIVRERRYTCRFCGAVVDVARD